MGKLVPGQQPDAVRDQADLLISSLRSVNQMSGLLNDLSAELMKGFGDSDDPRIQRMHALLLRRFSDCSGVHLFIGADNLGMRLPADLRGE